MASRPSRSGLPARRASLCALATLLLSPLAGSAAPFAPGNIVLYRVGDGVAALSNASTAVFLDEYTPAGTFVQSVAMPTMTSPPSFALTSSGTSAEGLLTRSVDGRYLIVSGYGVAPGLASVATSTAVAANRVIGRVAADSTIDTTTTLGTTAFGGGSIRSAISDDGSRFWATGAGAGGSWAVLLGGGTPTQVSSTVTNTRGTGIFDGQLFISTQSGTALRLATVGTGLPTTTGQTMTNLPGFATSTTSPYGFFFADLSAGEPGVDTVYVANDDATGLAKWTRTGATWAQTGSVAEAVRGITGVVNGGTVTLFATRTAAGTAVITLTDATGYNGTLGGTATVLIASAGTNRAFRGVALAPENVVVDTAPTVTMTTPADDATGVAVDSNLSVTFSEPVNVTANAFTLSCVTSGAHTLVVTDGPTTFTLNPTGVFASNEVCTATVVASQVTDQDANDPPDNMAADFVFDFTTAAAPTVNIADASTAETNSGTTNAIFIVSLTSAAPFGGVQATATTSDGSATDADNDYEPLTAFPVTIPAGASGTSVAVTVNGDMTVEPDETFNIALANITGASAGDVAAVGTITNDDTVTAVLNIDDASKAEGDTSNMSRMQFTVSLTQPAPAGGVTFDITTAADMGPTGATPDADYTTTSVMGALIPEGTSSVQFNVPIIDDTDFEQAETFFVNVSNISMNATAGDTQGTGTITDNDNSISIGDASPVTEPDTTGTATATFTVTAQRPAPAGGIVVSYSTANSTATAGSDYTAVTNGTVTIPEMQTTATFNITVLGDIFDEPDETFFVNISTATPSVNVADNQGLGTITDNEPTPVEIHAIQGNGLRSPLAPVSGNGAGTLVLTVDNVVTALQANGTSQGFFIQTPTARNDADPLTSQGIFVFTGATIPAGIAVGDVVTVKGNAAEFFNFTQITSAQIVETASGATMPTHVIFDQNRPSRNPAALSCGATLGNFECFEAMRINIPVGVINAGNLTFGTDPIAEAYISTSITRGRREEGLRPGVTTSNPTVPQWDTNPELFELDADKLTAANNNLQLIGGSFFGAIGILGYDFGGYELWPTQINVLNDTLPRQVPVAAPTQMTIGSFNLLRLCETSNCNDSPVPTPTSIATQVMRLSHYIRVVMRAPDIIGVQEVETIALLNQLAARIAADGGPTYTAYLVEGNDPGGIDNGYLVREDRINVIRVRQLAEDETINDCSGTPPCAKHDRPPLLLEASYISTGIDFGVINNHIRSRSGLESGTLAEQNRIRAKRFAQGESIAQIVQRWQLAQEVEPSEPVGDFDTASTPLFLVGDYNAFEVSDGLVDVVGLISGTYDNTKNELQQVGGNITVPALNNAASSIPLEERYSYAFEENLGNVQAQEPRRVKSVQILDHGLYNHIAQSLFRGAAYGRTNVDAPVRLQTTGTDGIGISDHDGIVIYVDIADLLFSDGFEDPAP